jgi:Fe-S-cluster containining protein
MTHNTKLLKRVAEIYNWLDLQITDATNLAGKCQMCGKCCDFDRFDHRLFITQPEIFYFNANLSGEKQKRMTTGRCPYNIDGKCTVYQHRFAGCRIFCCKADPDFQSSLSELVLKKFKSLCTKFQITYRYTDLPTALNNFADV